jgi:hypothetical protein
LWGKSIKEMSITSKFKKDIQTLRSAVNGEFYLDVKNPKLYKKLYRYYENNGVVFSREPLDDYEILIDCLAEDLEVAGVLVK